MAKYNPTFIRDELAFLVTSMKAQARRAAGEASCSTANLGAGFDVFGLALNKYADRVWVRLTSGRSVRILVKGPRSHQISREAKKNSVGPPAMALLRKSGSKTGLEIIVEKNVPQGLGLGSSGASAAACTKIVDHLLGLQLPTDELVRTASLGEKAVTGTAHADNVAASIIGGFVIVYGNPIRTISFKPPPDMTAVVASPRLAIARNKTRRARGMIPKRVDVKKAVLNIGRASAIVAGFAKGDIQTIGMGMEDEIAEPYREASIPGFNRVRRAALEAGAAGVSISGAGPSVIAIVDRKNHEPQTVGRAMIRGFAESNVSATWFTARPASGARIIEMR